jgi:protein TonB
MTAVSLALHLALLLQAPADHGAPAPAAVQAALGVSLVLAAPPSPAPAAPPSITPAEAAASEALSETPPPLPERPREIAPPIAEQAPAEQAGSRPAPVQRPAESTSVSASPKRTPSEAPAKEPASADPPATERGTAAAEELSAAVVEQRTQTPQRISEPRYRFPPTPPTYPRRAARLGQEGTVLVRARLSTTGEVLEVELGRSSGHPLLDAAARDAVKGWAFQPARRDGRAVLGVVDVPVHFRLR